MTKRFYLRGLAIVTMTIGLTISAMWLLYSAPALATDMIVYKSPQCGCCQAWIDHLKANGYSVTVKPTEDIEAVKTRLGVPKDIRSCHTGVIGNYVIEGHVPAADITLLLMQKPEAKGLSVPGMPIGSPGMEQGDKREPYQVILFSENDRKTFSSY